MTQPGPVSPIDTSTLLESGVLSGQTIEVIYQQIMGEQPGTAGALGHEWHRAAQALRSAAEGVKAAAASLADWQSPAAKNAYLSRNDQVVSEMEANAENAQLVSTALYNLAMVMREGQTVMQEMWDAYQQELAAAAQSIPNGFDPVGVAPDIETVMSHEGLLAAAQAEVRAKYNERARLFAAALGAQYAPSIALLHAATFNVQKMDAVSHPGAFGVDLPPIVNQGGGPGNQGTGGQQRRDPPQFQQATVEGRLEQKPRVDPPPRFDSSFDGQLNQQQQGAAPPPEFGSGQPPGAEPAAPPPEFDGGQPPAAEPPVPPPAFDAAPPPAAPGVVPPPALGEGGVVAPPAGGVVAPPVGVIRPPGFGVGAPGPGTGRPGLPPGLVTPPGSGNGAPGGGVARLGSPPPGALGVRPPGTVLPPGFQGGPPGSVMPPGGYPGAPTNAPQRPAADRRNPNQPGALGPTLPGTGVPAVPGAPAPASAGPDRRADGQRTAASSPVPGAGEAFTPPVGALSPPVLGDPERRRSSRSDRLLPPALARLLNGSAAPSVGTPPVLVNQHAAGPRLTYTEQREAARRARRERARELARRRATPTSVFAADLPEGAPTVLAGRPVAEEPPADLVEVPRALRVEAPVELPESQAAPVPPPDLATRRVTADGAAPARPADLDVWEVDTPGGPVVAGERPPRREVEPPPRLGAQG